MKYGSIILFVTLIFQCGSAIRKIFAHSRAPLVVLNGLPPLRFYRQVKPIYPPPTKFIPSPRLNVPGSWRTVFNSGAKFSKPLKVNGNEEDNLISRNIRYTSSPRSTIIELGPIHVPPSTTESKEITKQKQISSLSQPLLNATHTSRRQRKILERDMAFKYHSPEFYFPRRILRRKPKYLNKIDILRSNASRKADFGKPRVENLFIIIKKKEKGKRVPKREIHKNTRLFRKFSPKFRIMRRNKAQNNSELPLFYKYRTVGDSNRDKKFETIRNSRKIKQNLGVFNPFKSNQVEIIGTSKVSIQRPERVAKVNEWNEIKIEANVLNCPKLFSKAVLTCHLRDIESRSLPVSEIALSYGTL